jgi:hypothetical protein
LLNFLLAYMRWLQAGAAEGTGVDDWLDWAFAHGQIQQREQQQSGGDARASGGFRWSGGRRRVTVGIQVWPEAFLVGKNDDTVVLLVDSQGLFDSHTNMQGNTVIFVLSSLLSSVQVGRWAIGLKA